MAYNVCIKTTINVIMATFGTIILIFSLVSFNRQITFWLRSEKALAHIAYVGEKKKNWAIECIYAAELQKTTFDRPIKVYFFSDKIPCVTKDSSDLYPILYDPRHPDYIVLDQEKGFSDLTDEVLTLIASWTIYLSVRNIVMRRRRNCQR